MFQENKIIVRRDHLFTDGATILLHNIHEFILTHNIKEKTRFIDELEERGTWRVIKENAKY